uniref:hypothetical protein n=1 Tax=Brachyspira hyodysenteriae TaxID=159 RepID=UPI00119828FB
MTLEVNRSAKKNSTRLIPQKGKETRFVETKNGLELRVGSGKDERLMRRKLVLFARKSIVCAKQNKLKILHTDWSDWRAIADKTLSDAEVGEVIAIAFLMANFEFIKLKTKPKEGFGTLETVVVAGAPSEA